MVLLHGRGGTASDILSLERDFNLSAFTYLAPQAEGNTWYPLSFLAPVEQNQPHLDRALGTVDAVMGELAARGFPAERVVLGGFSQGACLALEYASRTERKPGAVVAFSGGLITLDQGSAFPGTPVFMGVDPRDGHIPSRASRKRPRSSAPAAPAWTPASSRPGPHHQRGRTERRAGHHAGDRWRDELMVER